MTTIIDPGSINIDLEESKNQPEEPQIAENVPHMEVEDVDQASNLQSQMKHYIDEPQAGIDKFTMPSVYCLVGAWLIHLVAGSQYAWGNMLPYLVSYFRNNGHDWVNDNNFYSVMPIIVTLSSISFPLGMMSANKLGSRFTVLIGGFFITAAVFICSLSSNPYLFLVVYAGGFGIGKGFIYSAPLRAAWSHLPGRKGFVSGTVVSGLGLGAFVYGIVVNKLVNPDNLSVQKVETQEGQVEYLFSSEVTDRVPMMLMTLGICWSAQLVLGFLLISDFRKPTHLPHNGEQGHEQQSEFDWEEIHRSKLDRLAEKAPIRKVVCSFEFFQLYCITVCQLFYGYYIMIVFKSQGAVYISDDKFLTIIGSVGALFNGISRIFWASLLDYYPFRSVNLILIAIQLACIMTVEVSAQQSKYAYFVVIALSMMCEGSIAAILPTVTLTKFGTIRGHDVFSFMYSAYGISSLLGMFLVSQLQNDIGFKGMLLICLALCITAAVITFASDDRHFFNYFKFAQPEDKFEFVIGEIQTNKHGVAVREFGQQWYEPYKQRKRPGVEDTSKKSKHKRRIYFAPIEYRGVDGKSHFDLARSMTQLHHGADLAHRHHTLDHLEKEDDSKLRKFGKLHFAGESEMVSIGRGGLQRSFSGMKAKDRHHYQSDRHVSCHMCTIHGKRDGTMIWGRRAHLGKINTERLLKARTRRAREFSIYRTWWIRNIKKKNTARIKQSRAARWLEKSDECIPEEREYPIRHENPSNQHYQSADFEQESAYYDLTGFKEEK